jgi:hypothetical protein
MSRPTVEVADILRAQGNRFLDRYEKNFDFQQLKAFVGTRQSRWPWAVNLETDAIHCHRDIAKTLPQRNLPCATLCHDLLHRMLLMFRALCWRSGLMSRTFLIPADSYV